VHYFAGLDRVQLHPAGLLRLLPAEQAALASDFNQVFGDGRWRLHSTGGRELLLGGPALEAHGGDPARFLGRELDGAQVHGAGATELRRLAVEIEMWLHEHPVNRRRLAESALPVTGLWFWGTQPLRFLTPASMSRATAKLYGEDTFADSLWRSRGATTEALPPRLPAPWTASQAAGAVAHVVLIPTAGEAGLSDCLDRLEREWLAPAVSALRAGKLAAVRLLGGVMAYHQRRLDRLRFWRRRASWHQVLA
jgi:hypothetical protein